MRREASNAATSQQSHHQKEEKAAILTISSQTLPRSNQPLVTRCTPARGGGHGGEEGQARLEGGCSEDHPAEAPRLESGGSEAHPAEAPRLEGWGTAAIS